MTGAESAGVGRAASKIAIGAAAALAVVMLRAVAGSDAARTEPPSEPGASALDDGGSNLWITREQRAQRLLDAGHPAEAARLFKDPRRKAYADLRAGRDADAARILAPLHDPQSEYNRGNALARSGALLGALAAYDAALQQTPGDRDIRHNRDLVARVLASRAQSGSGSQSGQSGKQGNRGQSGNGEPRGSAEQSAQDARSGRSSQAGRAASAGGATPEQEAEQAREDAALAAALRRRGAQQNGQQQAGTQRGAQSGTQTGAQGGEQGSVGLVRGGKTAEDLPWPPPKSEQALALDQWLRRIPEDPGGLLRRKFLIEHMERQEAEQ